MNERSLFLEALEKEDAAQRSAFLDGACAGDEGLRQRVEALLKSHFEAGNFLDKLAPERLAEEWANQPIAVETQSPTLADAHADDGLDFLSPAEKPGLLGRLGHYEVSEVIGRGGMGVVLKAFDQTLQRVVAIKVLAAPLATSATARRRFVREAQAAAAVRNEHVIDIHAVEEAGERPYLVMEYVSGVSLQQRLDRAGPLEVKEILRIGIQTAAGLAAAHAQGLVHRDIKPANILLENGVERVKLTDFGLARAVDDASLTQSGVIAGTPQYMAPEQARGEVVDHRADLFSLGSVLYALCTGRAPFWAIGTMAVLKRVCEDMPRPIPEINPEVPDWLAALIARLHAKDPADRPQSAAEVTELLSAHLASLQQNAAVRIRPGPRSPGRRGRGWRVAAAALVLLLGSLTLTEATGVTRVAATVLRILTPDGTLAVEVEDANVKVTIEGDGGLVITGAGPQEVRLRPGSYRLRATKDGKPIQNEVVTISRGDKQVVRVSLEGAGLARSAFPFKPPPPGPLDRLDPAKIPAWERFPWQPKELVAVLGEHRGRHWGPITCVTFSPDGKRAASCGHDRPVFVWDADTLHLRAVLMGHTQGNWCVAFSPDGRRLLSAGEDQTVRLWDVDTGQELRRFEGHAGTVWSVAYGRDGRHALSGEADRIVRLWDVETGKEVRRFEGHSAAACSVGFTPDGLHALSGSSDRTMRLWELKTGKEVRKFEGHADNFRIVTCLPDGRRALSCSHDKTLRLWDLDSGQEVRCYEGHTDAVFGVAISPDGRRALSCGPDRTIRLWDVETGQELRQMPCRSTVSSVAFSPDGRRALSGSDSGNLRLWDLKRGVEHDPFVRIATRRGRECVSRVVFSPDGRRLLTCTGEEIARLWDVAGGKELRRFRMPPDIWDVAFSSDGRRVFASGASGVGIWAAETGAEVRHIQPPSGTWGMVLSGDDRWLVTAGTDGRVHMWDVASGRELQAFTGHERGVVLGVAVSPGRRRLLSGGDDNTVRLWDLDSGAQLQRVEGPAPVWSVAFSPSGRQAASSDDQGFVRHREFPWFYCHRQQLHAGARSGDWRPGRRRRQGRQRPGGRHLQRRQHGLRCQFSDRHEQHDHAQRSEGRQGGRRRQRRPGHRRRRLPSARRQCVLRRLHAGARHQEQGLHPQRRHLRRFHHLSVRRRLLRRAPRGMQGPFGSAGRSRGTTISGR
jgi:WD40 repeat protein